MGNITVQINSVDQSSAIDISSLTIREQLRARGTTCEFTYRSINGVPAAPQGGNEVFVLNGATREFAGHILIPSFVQWTDENGNRGYDYACQCADYTWEFDRKYAYVETQGAGTAAEYPSQEASLIVKDLVSKYTDGNFGVTLVQTAFTVTDKSFDALTLSEILDQIAREVGYLWRIDYNKNVVFFVVENAQAPIATLNLDIETRIYAVSGDNGDASQVKNPVTLKDVELMDPVTITEVFTANGVSRFFPLSYPPSPRQTAGAPQDVIVTVGGGTQKLAFDDQSGFTPTDGSTASGTAWLCVFNRGLRMGSAYSAGTVISATYNRMIPRLARYMDAARIAKMATRENISQTQQFAGWHEYVLSLPQLQAATSDAIGARAQLVLAQYADPRVRVNFKTQLVSGWQVGQYLQVSSSLLGINQRMYVSEITKRITAFDTMEYEVKLLDQLQGDG